MHSDIRGHCQQWRQELYSIGVSEEVEDGVSTESQVGGSELDFYCGWSVSIFLKILFIHERHRERQRHRQREKQAPSVELDVGLDPGTTGSRPEPKTDAQPLSHPGISHSIFRVYVSLLF